MFREFLGLLGFRGLGFGVEGFGFRVLGLAFQGSA